MFIDSHCHLDRLKLDAHGGALSTLLERAHGVGVEHMLCVATDLASSARVSRIAEQFSSVSASVGVHPSEVCDSEPDVEHLLQLVGHPQVVAIGETGLDYYYNHDHLDVMRERFRVHIQAAKTVGKPLIIHSRNAREDTIRLLQSEGAAEVGGVMHCFTESWEMAQEALALGFYISISGIVTFKNAKQVAEVAQRVPLERLLIETDAPFLAPVPHRGQQNEPQYLPFVAEKIAQLRGLPVEEIAQCTTQNFWDLFGSRNSRRYLIE